MTLPSLRDSLYLLAELILCILLALVWGLIQHRRGVDWQLQQDKNAVVLVNKISPMITEKVVREYIPKIEYIKGQTVSIIKKVPVYVTEEDNFHATINNGFVSMWNATNKMQLPSSPGADYEKSSYVVLSDIAAEHAREAAICTETERQRDALKDWILSQQKLYNNK